MRIPPRLGDSGDPSFGTGCRYKRNFPIYTHFDRALSFSVEPFRNMRPMRLAVCMKNINNQSNLLTVPSMIRKIRYSRVCVFQTFYKRKCSELLPEMILLHRYFTPANLLKVFPIPPEFSLSITI